MPCDFCASPGQPGHRALIRDLLWPDPRVVLQARLTDVAYVPVSDWSQNFILADNQAACDHVPPPAAPSDFKVLMINFNPIIEAQGGVRLTQLISKPPSRY